MSTPVDQLISLQQKIELEGASGRTPSLEPFEVDLLIRGFHPSHSTNHRTQVLVLLTRLCQAVRGSTLAEKQEPNAAAQALTAFFAPPVTSRLGDVEEQSVVEGLAFLTSLFHVDREVASAIFLRDGIALCVADSVDLFSSVQFSLELAHLVSQASGSKPCREVLPPQISQWLSAQLRPSTDSAVQAAAAVALVKIMKGRTSDDPAIDASGGQIEPNRWEDLASLMKAIVIDDTFSALPDAIEGLAFITVDPSVKESLSRDPIFLSRLFALVPSRRRSSPRSVAPISSALLYGVAVIISNICLHPPRLNHDAAQVEALKQFVKRGKKPGQKGPDSGLSVLDDPQHCTDRTRRLVASGVVDVLTRVVYSTDSKSVRSTVGRAFLDIVEDNGNRGVVLQSGGAKALTVVIQQSLQLSGSASLVKPDTLPTETLFAIQALAKLAITSSPVQVFGPNEGVMCDAIRPLAFLLLHSSSSLLQRFESMMALTNLSSQSPELASRIAETENLVDRVELFLLDDHTLIRRAATELICNLVGGSDDLLEKYSTSESKLQVMLALSDVDDVHTRLAASGTLATLTMEPAASRALLELQMKKRRVFMILTQLVDPPSSAESESISSDTNPGLVHRGVICARNFLQNIQDLEERHQIYSDAEKAGLTKALAKVAQDRSVTDAVKKPAADALNILSELKL